MKSEMSEQMSSHDVVNSGKGISIAGFLSRDEFMKTLAKAFGQSTLIGVLTFAGMTILGDFDKWYIGPYHAEAATVATMVFAYFKARRIGEKYLETGDPLKDVRK